MKEVVIYSKQIPLTRGRFALVGYWWSDFLMQFKWNYVKVNHSEYAWLTIYNKDKTKRIANLRMHCLIKGKNIGFCVNHIDKNGLNNHELNLRFASKRELNMTRTGSGRSKYLGVNLELKCRKPRYRASIRVKGKLQHLGSFTYDEKGEIAAAIAYDKAAILHHGDFANLNFINGIKNPLILTNIGQLEE